MSKYDKRRSRYVPLDVFVAFDEFGSKLIEKWGMEGLCCWMLLLAAAKREVTQGLFTYTSEDEAWSKLGARPDNVSLDEFLRFAGQCKKTKKTRQGRVTYVQIRKWEKWNRGPGQVKESSGTGQRDVSDTKTDVAETFGTAPASQQNPRSEQENTNGLRENTNGIEKNARAEVEVELEVEDERTRALPSTETHAPAPETNRKALVEDVREQVIRSLREAAA
jgi:hypothetical protein